MFLETNFAPDLPPRYFSSIYRVHVSQRCSLVLIGRAHARARDPLRSRNAQQLQSVFVTREQVADNSLEPISSFLSPSLCPVRNGNNNVEKGKGAENGVTTATSASVPRSRPILTTVYDLIVSTGDVTITFFFSFLLRFGKKIPFRDIFTSLRPLKPPRSSLQGTIIKTA